MPTCTWTLTLKMQSFLARLPRLTDPKKPNNGSNLKSVEKKKKSGFGSIKFPLFIVFISLMKIDNVKIYNCSKANPILRTA